MFFNFHFFSLILFTFLYLTKHVPRFRGGFMAGFILWARFVSHRGNCLYVSLFFFNLRCFFLFNFFIFLYVSLIFFTFLYCSLIFFVVVLFLFYFSLLFFNFLYFSLMFFIFNYFSLILFTFSLLDRKSVV